MRGGEKRSAKQHRERPLVFPIYQIEDQSNEQINEQNVFEHRGGEIRRAFHEHQANILSLNAKFEFEEGNGKEIDEAENRQREKEGVAKFLIRMIDGPMVMVFEENEQPRAKREANEAKNQKRPFPEPRLQRQKWKQDIKSHERDDDKKFFLNRFAHGQGF